MSQVSEFTAQKEFVQEYYKNISQSSVDALSSYLKKVVKKNNSSSIASLLNEIKEGNGRTAIHIAASRGDLKIFKYLVEVGADYHVRDSNQNTPLHIAVEHQREELVKYLLDDLHFDVNQDRNSITPLHQAAQNGNIPLIELLLSHRANIDAPSQYGSPLMFAAANQQNWVVHLLLNKGAKVNYATQSMPPVLHLVIDQNNKELFKIFIEHSEFDSNIVDHGGWSALQLCAELGRTEMLKSLISLGADVDYENEGQTALDVAVVHGQWDCVEQLRNRTRKQEIVIQPSEALQEQELNPEQVQQALEKCLSLKEQGNIFFQKSDLDSSLKLYQEAYDTAQLITKQHPIEIVPIYSNLAQTYLKLKSPKKTLEICNQARLLNPKWTKIYFLEGLAYEELQDYGESAASYFDGLKVEHTTLFKQMFDKAIQKGKDLHQKRIEESKK